VGKVIYALGVLVVIGCLALGQKATGQEPVWWVWGLWPKDIAWIAMAPAMSYSDCVERMLPKVRLLINRTTAWDQPLFKCEVKP